jgi:DNA invertase Pin-like site-specific DNA recombinase
MQHFEPSFLLRTKQAKEMLDFVRENDVIYIHDFSRLARSTTDLLNIVKLLETKK